MVSIMRMKPWYMPMVGTFGDDELDDMDTSYGINVYEKDGVMHLEAPVPGVPADKVEVTYADGKIHVFAKHEEKNEEKNKKHVVYRMERNSAFEYMADVPSAIDEKSIEAEVKDGVVYVTAKITEGAKPRKIVVKHKGS